MTYDKFVAIAMTFSEVEESISYGSPCVKRGKRMMFSPRKSENAVAIKIDWETRDRLLDEQPERYFITPHYHSYPWLLARLDHLTEEAAKILIGVSWEDAPFPQSVALELVNKKAALPIGQGGFQ